MKLIKTKWVFYRFMPFEYEDLEKYLNNMALRGWILEDIRGYFLKLKRIEPRKLKYSINMIDEVSFFDLRDSDESMKYRDYCEEVGWNFICERDKIQVYYSEEDLEIIDIHTDEREKFEAINKVSKKYVLLNLFIVCMMMYTQYINTIGNYDTSFLFYNFQLISLIFIGLFIIEEGLSIINYFTWRFNARKNLDVEEKVIYKGFFNSFIKVLIGNITIAAIMLYFIYFSVSEGFIDIVMILIILISCSLVPISRYFIKRTNHSSKKKREMNIIAQLTVCIVTFSILITYLNINILKVDNEAEIVVGGEEYELTIEDLGDKRIEDGHAYLDYRESILGSRKYYSVEGKLGFVSYELVKSDYEWVINYTLDKILGHWKDLDVDFEVTEENISNNIKIYAMNSGNMMIMLSKDKLIKMDTWSENLKEKEVLDIIYNKIFEKSI
ncbi:DUF2812 domain-containing protein [Clostridium sp.]|uniref:DUF2812 domain-containing protein n=1 Tax=Clostridium sp. TaxID=1506 RepID=UPI003F3C2E86